MKKLAAIAVAAAAIAPGTAPTDTTTLTFDWPLGCAATVVQDYVDADWEVSVTYTVEAREGNGAVVIEFGEATVLPLGVKDVIGAFFTNPTIEVDLDGAPVEAIGFEEWFESVEGTAVDVGEATLERSISHRTAVIVWDTWVGLWATLPPIEGDFATFEDVPFVDADLQRQTAPLDVVVEPGDGETRLLAERTVDDRLEAIEVTTDPATLQPVGGGYTASEGGEIVVWVGWYVEWPECDTAESTADIAAEGVPPAPTTTDARPGAVIPPGFDAISRDELPPEARDTLALIEKGGPFPYRQDDAVFENREGILPDRPYGYYHEYTVETPGSPDRGPRRIVTGERGETYYTDDHYDTFRVVIP